MVRTIWFCQHFAVQTGGFNISEAPGQADYRMGTTASPPCRTSQLRPLTATQAAARISCLRIFVSLRWWRAGMSQIFFSVDIAEALK